MDTTQAHIKLATLFPFFHQLSQRAREDLLTNAPLRSAPAGTVLFTPGTLCEMFPLVVEGVVRVSKVGAKGRDLPLYRVRAGESCVLTTSCLLGEVKYSATGVVEEDLTALAVPQDFFSRFLAEQPAFRGFVFHMFTERMTDLMQVVEEVAFRRLDERLAALLLEQGNPVRLTHQRLADELGSVREMISRLLRGFQDRGWVVLRREQIEIVDHDALRMLGADQSVRTTQ